MRSFLLPFLLINLVYAEDIRQVGNTLNSATEVSNTLNSATGGIFGIMTHGEIETGRGTMSMEGGFLGLNGKISDNVTTYTLKTEHQNAFIKHLNYSYKINWYDSNKMNQALSTYNGSVLPSMDYSIRGLDADVGLGWNLIDLGSHDYFSLGVDVGLSTPYIKATKSSSTSNPPSSTLYGTDDTKIWTYKVGPQIKASKSLTSHVSLYGSATYAYQYASIKNSSIGLDTHADGTFTEGELGLRYQPLEKKYPLTSWFSLSPQLYFTAGARYNKWSLYDVAIDLFNLNSPLPKSELSISSTSTYLGLGYSF